MLGNSGLSICGDDRAGTNLSSQLGLVGSVFYVDTAANGGSDSNSGRSPGDPLLKINAAMDLCTASKGDVIFVLGNSPSSPNDTATITCDVAGVTIRGLYGKGMLSDSGFGSPTQNVACITIAAHYVTIENLYLGTNASGSTGGIVEFSGTGSYFGVTFRNITFDTQYVAAYGIYAAYDQPYLLVDDCTFGRYDIAGYTTAGIYLGNGTADVIRRNTFNACAGVAISLGAGCGNVSVLDNTISMPSDTEGKAITCASGSSGNWIDGNRAGFGMDSMAANPYLDSNGDDSNNWGLNYNQEAATLPTS